MGPQVVLVIVHVTRAAMVAVVVVGIGTKATKVEIHVIKWWRGLDMVIQRRMHSVPISV
jgi:hypothetical protein